MRRLPLIIALLLAVAAADPEGARWYKHLRFLASDEQEGRGTGTPGYDRSARYVAREFERIGLQTIDQPIEYTLRRTDQAASRIDIGGHAIVVGRDAFFSARGGPNEDRHVDAPVVFAGYGLVMPELQYDDLEGLDVKGKLVAYMAGAPASVRGPLESYYQGERWEAFRARGAAGAIAINNPQTLSSSWETTVLYGAEEGAVLADAKLRELSDRQVAIVLGPAVTPLLFEGSGHTLDEILKLDTAGERLPRFALNVKVKADQILRMKSAKSSNVIGILRGSDPKLRGECVVVSAHLDHLGIGTPVNGDAIYNGALDNASGVATLIELARDLKRGKPPQRSVVFVAFSGEEPGSLGSWAFVSHPPPAIGRIVANLNIDGVSPFYPFRFFTGIGSEESTLGDDAAAVAAAREIRIAPDPAPARGSYALSDQYSFALKGIPALLCRIGTLKGSPEGNLIRGIMADVYHQPSDDLHLPFKPDEVTPFHRFMTALIRRVADDDEAPRWKEQSFYRRFVQAMR